MNEIFDSVMRRVHWLSRRLERLLRGREVERLRLRIPNEPDLCWWTKLESVGWTLTANEGERKYDNVGFHITTVDVA